MKGACRYRPDRGAGEFSEHPNITNRQRLSCPALSLPTHVTDGAFQLATPQPPGARQVNKCKHQAHSRKNPVTSHSVQGNSKRSTKRGIPKPYNIGRYLLKVLSNVSCCARKNKAGAHEQDPRSKHKDKVNARVSVQVHTDLITDTRYAHEGGQPQQGAEKIQEEPQRVSKVAEGTDQHHSYGCDTGYANKPTKKLALLQSFRFYGEKHETALIQGSVKATGKDRYQHPPQTQQCPYQQGK